MCFFSTQLVMRSVKGGSSGIKKNTVDVLVIPALMEIELGSLIEGRGGAGPTLCMQSDHFFQATYR